MKEDPKFATPGPTPRESDLLSSTDAARSPAELAPLLRVVGIGASAGGLEPLCTFFENISHDTGAAFVVVQHLSPDFKSMMDELLARHTAMPIVRITDPTDLQPNHIYLVMPRSDVVVAGTRLLPRQAALHGGTYHPINAFLSSLSSAFAERAVAVILSGTGTDGANGVRMIHEAGGTVFVEDPHAARFDGMPRAAIATGFADFILETAEIPRRLERFLEHPLDHAVLDSADDDPDLPGGTATEIVERVLSLLRRRINHDFRGYRRATLHRRIHRRMALRHITTLPAYFDLLRESEAEQRALHRDFLIGVTSFFRDDTAFDRLHESVIVPVVEAARSGDEIRVWVPACSTGEEAYSIAMLVTREVERSGKILDYRIFATDVSREAIEVASAGFYDQNIEDSVPATMLEHFFVRRANGYQIKRELREHVVFAVHDLTRDPPFTRMDLVSCRNLLIYLRTELQQQVMNTLTFAVRVDRFLFLGHSEAVHGGDTALEAVDEKWRIFRRTQAAAPAYRLPVAGTASPRWLDPTATRRVTGAARTHPIPHERLIEALLGETALFGLILDENMRLLHVYGDPGHALRVPSGSITTDIAALTHGEFKTALATGVQRVTRTSQEVLCKSVRIDHRDENEVADIRVFEVVDDRVGQRAFAAIVQRSDRPASSRTIDEVTPDEQQRIRVRDLEEELKHTRENLHSTIEEIETANEELQTTNEEMTAANEELQSTNEELHSANEELFAVNAEHQEKIRELRELSDDLENLLDSTDVGSVFLDRSLRVRRFTPAAQRVIYLLEQDIGRPMLHIRHSLRELDLVALAQQVAASGEELRQRVRSEDDRSFLLRVSPYQAAQEAEGGGIVLTLSDVTDLETVRQELEASHERLETLMANLRQAVFLREVPGLEISYMSPYFATLWSLSTEEIRADRDCWRKRVHPNDLERMESYVERIHEGSENIDYRVVHPDGSEHWLNTVILPVHDAQGNIMQEVGYTHEITERKRIEMALGVSVDRARLFVEALPDQLLWVDETGHWRRFHDVLDPMQADALGPSSTPTFVDTLPPDARRAILGAAEAARTSGHLQTIALDLHHAEGAARSYEARLLSVRGRGTVCMVRDISDLRASERELVDLTRTLEQQANHDHLTNLPNRRGLEKMLFVELERCRRLGARMSAVLIDCDNFKRINDSMGHATGDVVLQEIGKRLRDVVRPSDSIGRVGGDEFLVLLPDTRVAEAMQLAERLRLSVTDTPLKTAEQVIGVTASLGVAAVPQDVVSIEEVVSHTQHALSHSKRAGKNRVSLGQHATRGDETRFERILDSLQTGEGFRIFAQPILDMSTSTVVGYELLTRGPSGLLESPEDLFRLSAENNILTSVDLHCVKRSVAWARDRLNGVRFHINLFPSTLLDTPAARLLAVFGDPGLLANFCVEISEQQFIGDPLYLRPHVQELRREGARIAIDDVGFGRSSLEALIVLEPDSVKLDKSVVIGVAEDRSKRHVLQRLMKVIEGIDAQAVAEGVETEADRDCLLDLGLTFGQGFLFGRPAPEMLGKS